MKFIRDDGGRKAAGFKGTAPGDCVTRAIAIATETPYQQVYDSMNVFAKTFERSAAFKPRRRVYGYSTSRTGILKPTIRAFMGSIGWRWTPTMGIGAGCTVHLKDDELPAGRLVVNVSRHSCAVIDGVLRDLNDCTRGGRRCVYGYFSKG